MAKTVQVTEAPAAAKPEIPASHATETPASTKTEAQDTCAQSTDTSVKFAENLIDYNAAVIKSGEELAKKAYDNYLSNLATAFDSAKALTKTTDVADFYKVAASNCSAAYEKFLVQGNEFAELSAKALEENTESAKKMYSKALAA